jgi:hypothetical protein
MRTRTTPPAVALALLTAAAVVLAGCTHSGKASNASLSLPPSPSVTVLGLPVGVVNATAVPSVVPNNTASRKNVTISTCKSAGDGWQASGTATNPSAKQTAYTVTVFFTTPGGTVIGTGQTTVTVKPKDHRPWTVSATFHAAPQTRCVLRGVG